MRPKSFVTICITYVYTIDTIDIPTMGSHRDNMFSVYVIHSNCARLHNFFLWWTMVKMAIYTHKCEQKWLKINNRLGGGGGGEGGGIKMSWVEKNRKINYPGRGGWLFGTREYETIKTLYAA